MSYSMGFKVGNTAIPDPSAFSGKESDLDTMGERDATGYLHRNRVATKHPLNLEYKNIPWSTILEIGSLLTNAKFSFTYPDPFSSTGTRTGPTMKSTLSTSHNRLIINKPELVFNYNKKKSVSEVK